MTKIDKYKIAMDIKNNNPELTHVKAMELAKEVEKMYLDGMGIKEAIAKAKEVTKNDSQRIRKI